MREDIKQLGQKLNDLIQNTQADTYDWERYIYVKAASRAMMDMAIRATDEAERVEAQLLDRIAPPSLPPQEEMPRILRNDPPPAAPQYPPPPHPDDTINDLYDDTYSGSFDEALAEIRARQAAE